MAEDIQAEAKPERKKKEKIIQTMGTRKRAIARATIKAGKGVVRINAKPLDLWEPSYARLRLREPIMLAEQVAGGVDIEVNVTGGGFWG
jgi:small subunit ribosomal protein S9